MLYFPPVLRRLLKLPLHFQILAALVLALIAGRLSGTTGAIGGLRWFEIYDFVGQLFLRGLRMLVVPLIASAIITGIANLGAEHAFRRLGLKTLAYFLTTSVVAINHRLRAAVWIWSSNSRPRTPIGIVPMITSHAIR